MRKKTFPLLILLLAAACAPRADPLPPSPLHPTAATTIPESATSTPAAINELPLFNARHDLAQRLNITPEEIEILEIEEVEWPDSSLGCPQPGNMYLQVITPGQRISLSAQGRTYSYHSDLRGHVVLCTAEGFPLPPSIPVDPGEIQDGEPWIPAD